MTARDPILTQAQGEGTTTKTSSAWVSARTSERAIQQQAFASDPKYKKYTQQVEKCLNSFDNVHEWADCIAFLKQLLKFKEIPRKLVVAKRLSQCLNPALPTGVHQRALDVYSHILRVLGTEGLKRDLPLWSSGLFPFFEYAATSVKPMLLDLYDTYYLPMQGGLRPVMKSFIIALLPGLEEETGEFFDKVLSLLDRLSGTVSPSFFLQNVWLIMLTTPGARGTSINYLSRRLPRLNADEGNFPVSLCLHTPGLSNIHADITTIVGRDIGLMIRAFASALEDDNLLVRRGALDILLQSIRADSAAVKMAQPEDRTILMRAATGVVLRRDLSLNRRLYTWLLGSDEKSENQIIFLREHVLDLLKRTLKDEMFAPSSDYSESRPFKIFISLLDKWEIGSALTDALVYDAFKAIKQLVELNSDHAQDMIMTASTLYEAVEPNVLWKQILALSVAEIMGDNKGCEAMQMALFILRTFKKQDDEIQGLHLPMIFSAIMDVLNVHIRGDASQGSSSQVKEALLLQEEILRHISIAALSKRPQINQGAQEATSSQSPYLFACTFYEIKPMPDLATHRDSSVIPFTSVFQDLIHLSTVCGKQLKGTNNMALLQDVFAHLLLLIGDLVKKLEAKSIGPFDLAWQPRSWLSTILGTFEEETSTFSTVDRIISLAIALHNTTALHPKLTIDERPTMNKMTRKLFKYLRPHCAVYHVRAVNLIWSLETATSGHPHTESIISQQMTCSEARDAQQAHEAFGVLWRLTGFRFKVPMLLVLDTLKSDDPSLHRIGETWMRCSLRSYLRVLDPILYDLLDPAIRRSPTTAKIHGKELSGFLYERSFDQRYIQHLLETLLSVVRFGGQGFAKTARSTAVRRTLHGGLLERIEAVGSPADASYLDVLIDVLVRFVQTEPTDALTTSMRATNVLIQSTSIDLLQGIVARGEIDNLLVDNIEAAVIGKLYFCVHVGRLDLQNKLLHILHSLISASTSDIDAGGPSFRTKIADKASEDHSTQDGSSEDGRKSYALNSLLIQTLVDGIAVASNRPVLQHWLDFVLMAVPQFQPALQAVVPPLNDCVCRQLRLALTDILQASEDQEEVRDIDSAVTDAEFIMLLNALERLMGLSLASVDSTSQEEENGVTDRSAQEGTGLLGYVSNVFSSDSVAGLTDDQVKTSSWTSKDDSLSMIYSRTRVRCRRVLENVFRVHSVEVLEAVINCWHRDKTAFSSEDSVAFELVDVLVASAQNAQKESGEPQLDRISSI
ncbi:hypothetical protein HWV62_28842 [Athelia sp. TMB]|nr:hypothetical protein HWV62_28842 [Athelia sp. TMB]